MIDPNSPPLDENTATLLETLLASDKFREEFAESKRRITALEFVRANKYCTTSDIGAVAFPEYTTVWRRDTVARKFVNELCDLKCLIKHEDVHKIVRWELSFGGKEMINDFAELNALVQAGLARAEAAANAEKTGD